MLEARPQVDPDHPGRHHDDVDILGRHDPPEVNVVTVCEDEGLASAKGRRDAFAIDLRLDFIRDEKGDDVGLPTGFGDGEDLEAVLFGLFRALVPERADDDRDPAVPEVQRLCAALVPVAD